MRWSIIQLIWFRELRDQLRDRRTILMIVLLPLILYPILGLLGFQFARAGRSGKPVTLGIQGIDYLPPLRPTSSGFSPLPAAVWLTLVPGGPGQPGTGGERVAVTAGLVEVIQRQQDDPPLVVPGPEGQWRFPEAYLDESAESDLLHVRPVDGDQAQAILESKEVDLLLIVPPDFEDKLNANGRPVLRMESREGDADSQRARRLVEDVLRQWKQFLKEVRFRRLGQSADFDDPLEVQDPERSKPPLEQATRGLHDQMIRLFPFMLVMWSLAGALYPAIDVCAGEKERGTMETLLISPASREEIVGGKFLTIWVFSAGTTLWNLACMGGATWAFSRLLPQAILAPAAVFWCAVSVLPLTAFFSAVCLAMGVYARSSKEGQYYLMPLFLVTLPLVFLTLAPGVELNSFYSLVPVTGVALLMQRLMSRSGLEQVPWLYFVPVLTAVVLYSMLALRWAVEQFKREEVLFREAERFDLARWLRRLFREKEARTSVGQALFCFAVIAGLRWLFFGTPGGNPSWLVQTGVGYATFLAPPLFMSLLLTTRPWGGLGLRIPSLRSLIEPVVLALLLLPALQELGEYARKHFPPPDALLAEQPPFLQELRADTAATEAGGEVHRHYSWWQYVLVLALLPAVCEELAFRGFIFSGLRGRLPARPAILISSFLFGVYHMNAFWFLPAFSFGVILGLFTVRSGSILPGMIFHFLCRLLPIGVILLQGGGSGGGSPLWEHFFRPAGVFLFSVLAVVFLCRLFCQASRVPERRSKREDED